MAMTSKTVAGPVYESAGQIHPPRWRGRLLVAALVLLGLGTLWAVVPAVWATFVPRAERGSATLADYGLVAEDVQFSTQDGVELAAWYVPSRNGSAVVLRHGSGSTATDVLPQAAVLAEHGFGVLITDARGHGLSGGRAMDFGWFGDLDTEAAVTYLGGRQDVDPGRIGVIGMSMGGEEALGAAAADPRISAVVAEGATARTEADKAWFAEVYGVRGRIQLGIEWLQYTVTDLLTAASKPIALADAANEAAPTPILLVTAGERADEGYAAQWIQDQTSGNVEIWTVPGADHIQGLAVDPTEWKRVVTGFLARNLGGSQS
jgi:pimeloyl-ACP methyl ester carboxylesterase